MAGPKLGLPRGVHPLTSMEAPVVASLGSLAAEGVDACFASLM
jgi:hypothetical protein